MLQYSETFMNHKATECTRTRIYIPQDSTLIIIKLDIVVTKNMIVQVIPTSTFYMVNSVSSDFLQSGMP